MNSEGILTVKEILDWLLIVVLGKLSDLDIKLDEFTFVLHVSLCLVNKILRCLFNRGIP